MKTIKFQPIGEIHSPFKKPKGTPIQPSAAKGTKGEVVLLLKLNKGLKDIEGFSHLILLYHFHRAGKYSLTARLFMEDKFHGIFSIRAPSRPNPIGLSVVKLIRVNNNILYIEDVDIIDKTPLLDIKPYVPAFGLREEASSGWLEKNIEKLPQQKDDGRFVNQ